MTIEYEQGPCGQCPVQAEGKINGLPFYFRSRGASWSLSIAATPDGDPLDDEARFYGEIYDGENSGDFRFGAEYADAVVLFPGGRGTDSMRREAERQGCGYSRYDTPCNAKTSQTLQYWLSWIP